MFDRLAGSGDEGKAQEDSWSTLGLHDSAASMAQKVCGR
jgi:hypothetical protein